MEDRVNLTNLGRGAAVEAFQHELERVLENVKDPNTEPKLIREITLKVKIKPDESRDCGQVSIQASSKLAPVRLFQTDIFIVPGADGEIEAVAADPKSPGFDFEAQQKAAEESGKVTLISGREGGSHTG
jgi:hypothetical protein